MDTALWDLLGQELGAPVVQLLGGACRDTMPAYASGGWADEEGIGAQLTGYVAKGFRAVKMRVGVMDGEPAFEYLEEMEVDDRAAFEAEIESSAAMTAMLEGWYARVVDQVVVFAEEVDQA